MEPFSGTSSGKSVSLDELVSLNSEIVALVRAGVPLESGLREVAQDHPEPLSTLTAALAMRLTRGDSLDEAIAAEGDRFPKIYRVVVEAGLKAGRLTAALEAVSEFALQLVDLRRSIALALVYPLVVMTLAYGLFVVFVMDMAQRLSDAHDSFGIPDSRTLQLLLDLDATLLYWVWVPPLIVIAALFWWSRGESSRSLDSASPEWLLGWLPGAGRIFANARRGSFANLLALLIEHQVPLQTAVVLAADATGDKAMRRSARSLAESTSRGAPLTGSVPDLDGFPPFLVWLMARGEQQGTLSKALRIAADMYRRRALHQMEWMKLTFPVLTGIVIGGGATLLYALTLFAPLSEMLKKLSS